MQSIQKRQGLVGLSIVHMRWKIMTDMQPKKMIILDILNVLRKHTDEDHRLSQHQIQNLMESEYGMKVD